VRSEIKVAIAVEAQSLLQHTVNVQLRRRFGRDAILVGAGGHLETDAVEGFVRRLGRVPVNENLCR
jgi:hypothetical protein